MRDTHAFHSELELNAAEMCAAYQTFLDLQVLPDIYLKETVDKLNDRIADRYKGEISDELLQKFREKTVQKSRTRLMISA